MVWGKSANANGGLGREDRRRVIMCNGNAGDRSVFTVSVDPGEESGWRGGRQPTWQPLSLHQAVTGCDSHPGDRGMLAASGTNSEKLLLRRWFVLLSPQKLSVTWVFGGARWK